MGKIKDLTGQKFGKLTVLKRANIGNSGHFDWWCVCECTPDKEILVNGKYLRSGDTRSCGCLKREALIERNTTHGMGYTRMYSIWQAMLTRCFNSHAIGYKFYGARGITVCDRWKNSFELFKEDMYESYLEHVEKYGEKNTSIDRIDVNGNYCPENCRWATWIEQCRNKRCLTLTYKGETHTVRQWSELLGINLATLWGRVLDKRPIDDILYVGNLKDKQAKLRRDKLDEK